MDISFKISDTNHVTEPLVEVTRGRDGVVFEEFLLPLAEVLTILNDSAEVQFMSTPVLPQSTVKYVKGSSTADVYIEVPKSRWDITYNKQKYSQVGFPRMIFQYKVSQNRVFIERIYAVKDKKPLTSETEIYMFPFSHVNETGGVCMGDNRLPACKKISDLSLYHTFFINSPFSSDWGAKTTKGYKLEDLFNLCKENDFDDELLIEMSGKTIEYI
ncbi:hypothetical protein [Bacillus altitudinis]|uniref:hypothetical protein n=1 Tax=Bacillus altitudinis TaxID=293387 RepID=UPI00228156F8|nr:hypothetical protein [Bacillus altitudinis]MCY7454337.1 prokaryotic E2 ligase family D protein [Bacillus altitudinis]